MPKQKEAKGDVTVEDGAQVLQELMLPAMDAPELGWKGDPRYAELETQVLDAIDALDVDDNQMARYVTDALTKLAGSESERVWELRRAYKDRAPSAVATSLTGLNNEESMELRHELKEKVPYEVAMSLTGVDSSESWVIRYGLKDKKSWAVAMSLTGLDSDAAWALRAELKDKAPQAVAMSCSGLDSLKAWEFRSKLLKEFGDNPYVLTALLK